MTCGLGWDYQEQEHKSGLIFVLLDQARTSFDTYTIVYHIDIGTYRKLTDNVNTCIDNIGKLCQRTPEKEQSCFLTIKQLQNQVTYMRRDETDIDAYKQEVKGKRSKRSWEMGGEIFHWAFGLMDARRAREHDRRITENTIQTERILNLVEEEIIYIKEVIAMSNETYNELARELTKLSHKTTEYWARANKDLRAINLADKISELNQLAGSLIVEHGRLSQQIIRCLENAMNGQITQLVPLEKLTEDLGIVAKNLDENQRLPIELGTENPLHIFKFSSISASLYGDRMFIEINIPIVERELYSIYKIIPVPTRVANHTLVIKTTMDYVMINNNDNKYIPIKTDEYSNAQRNIRGEKIIKPAENAHSDFEQTCEINIMKNPSKKIIMELCETKILPNSNYFIPINANDLYYVLINHPVSAYEYCRNKISESHHFERSGVLKLQQDCRINTDKISLRPRTNYKINSDGIIELGNHIENTVIDTFMEKTMNLTNITIEIPEMTILVKNHIADFNELSERADKLIEKTKMEKRFEKIVEKLAKDKIYIERDLEEIHRGDWISMGSSFGFSTIISIIILIIAVIYIQKKFFNVRTWQKLTGYLETLDPQIIPRLFVQRIFPKTPIAPRQQHQEIETD